MDSIHQIVVGFSERFRIVRLQNLVFNKQVFPRPESVQKIASRANFRMVCIPNQQQQAITKSLEIL